MQYGMAELSIMLSHIDETLDEWREGVA